MMTKLLLIFHRVPRRLLWLALVLGVVDGFFVDRRHREKRLQFQSQSLLPVPLIRGKKVAWPKKQRINRRPSGCSMILQQDQKSCDASLSHQTFSELYADHLPNWLLEKCKACGWEYPTLIQQRALDSFFGVGMNDPQDGNQKKDQTATSARTAAPNSLVIQAQTGSGKTLTYLLPLLAQLEHRSAIQAMIVVPTRELGLQVATVAKRLAAPRKFLIMSLLQGSTLKRQRAWAWAETPQVVIGTPSELLDMVQYGGLPRINSIQFVVVDEVDACLLHKSGGAAALSMSPSKKNGGGGGGGGGGDIASALHILLSKYLSPTYAVDNGLDDDSLSMLVGDSGDRIQRRFKRRQTVFASATIPQHRHFLKQCKANQWTLEEPMFVCTSPGEALPPTLQHAYMVSATMDKKLAALRRVITKLHSYPKAVPKWNSDSDSIMVPKKILIFCDTMRPMEEMANSVAHDLGGLLFQPGKVDLADSATTSAQPIVSLLRKEDSLTQRAGATQAFASGSSMRVLFTGDLAARGLDISGITHVIHFDLPPDANTYLHRSGRAGRLGQTKGQVLSIITPEQEFVLQRLSNALQITDLACVARQKVKEANTKKRSEPTES